MKVGVIADLHGNSRALAAALRAGREAGVERWLCAGDYIGYYHDAEGVFALLDAVDWIGVRGNHDNFLVGDKASANLDVYVAKYGSAIEIASTTLSGERLARLKALPARISCEIDGRSVLICHGSPWDPDLYVYPDASPEVTGRIFAGGEDLIVMGHTHYACTWRNDRSIAVNPGSVGQPRDFKPGACWALWDTKDNSVDMRRESYDMTDLIEECRRYDPGLSYLVDVLVRTS